jgi:hypothetical protein
VRTLAWTTSRLERAGLACCHEYCFHQLVLFLMAPMAKVEANGGLHMRGDKV